MSFLPSPAVTEIGFLEVLFFSFLTKLETELVLAKSLKNTFQPLILQLPKNYTLSKDIPF